MNRFALREAQNKKLVVKAAFCHEFSAPFLEARHITRETLLQQLTLQGTLTTVLAGTGES